MIRSVKHKQYHKDCTFTILGIKPRFVISTRKSQYQKSINLLQKLCININLFDGLIQSVLNNKSINILKVPMFLELKWESPPLHQNRRHNLDNLVWMPFYLHSIFFYNEGMKGCYPLFFTLPISLHIFSGVILKIFHQFSTIL